MVLILFKVRPCIQAEMSRIRPLLTTVRVIPNLTSFAFFVIDIRDRESTSKMHENKSPCKRLSPVPLLRWYPPNYDIVLPINAPLHYGCIQVPVHLQTNTQRLL